MWVIVFKFFGVAIATMTVIYLVGLVLRSARRLERRVADFKAEQEALKNRPGPINPYAALAELYNETPAPPRRSTAPSTIVRRGKIVRDERDET